MLFSGKDVLGHAGLWTSDGTTAGTHQITGIAGANATGLDPTSLVTLGNHVLFNGHDSNGLSDLWVTDGTATGTHELTVGHAPSDLTVVGNQVYFNAQDSFTGPHDLWVTDGIDGTMAHTHEVTVDGAWGKSLGLNPTHITYDLF